jgi:nitrate reductase beta subunit
MNKNTVNDDDNLMMNLSSIKDANNNNNSNKIDGFHSPFRFDFSDQMSQDQSLLTTTAPEAAPKTSTDSSNYLSDFNFLNSLLENNSTSSKSTTFDFSEIFRSS